MGARKLTPAQRRVLVLAAGGKVSRQIGYPYRWHAGDWVAPRSATCHALLDRGLIVLDFAHEDGRWVPAVVTAAGRALLDSLNPEGH